MKRTFISTLLLIAAISVQAAEPWSVERCMKYAADHSHSVRQRQFDLDENRSAKTRAIGAFLPEVYGSVSAQMNFGRAVDPETNAYTDVSTFYNGYGLQASLTIFDGLQHREIHQLLQREQCLGGLTLHVGQFVVVGGKGTLGSTSGEGCHSAASLQGVYGSALLSGSRGAHHAEA